jgi:uncharacterized membrane protein
MTELRNDDMQGSLGLRKGLWASALVLLLMAAASAWAWVALPADAELAVHWDAHGKPDGFAPKTSALLFMPLSTLFTTAILAVAPALEPRRRNLVRSSSFYLTLWIGVLLLLALAHAVVIAGGFGLALPVVAIMIPATGLFIAVFGNLLGKTRPNFMAGIRTPWSLSSALAWEKSHRWTGRLLVLSGLGTVLASLGLGPGAGVVFLVASTLASMLTGVVLSYLFWRRDPARFDHDGAPYEEP